MSRSPGEVRVRSVSHRDRIEILGFELLLYCGVLPEEKIRRQPFRIDLELEVDLSAPAETDDLDRPSITAL